MSFKSKKDKKLFLEHAGSGIFLEDLTEKKKSFKQTVSKCFWNGLLTFLLVFGITGLFVDSFDVPCSLLVISIVQLILSMYFSFLYLNSITFNFGYILMLIIIVFIISSMYMIVNSGFSAILNIIIVKIDEVMNLPYLREFNEFFTNRYISITSCIGLISILFICLVNMFISRRKSILGLILFILPLFELSIYLSDDFSMFYTLIILFSLLLFVVTKSSDDMPGEYKKTTKNYNVSSGVIYFHNGRIERRSSIVFSVLISAVILFLSIISFTFVSSIYTSASSSLKVKSDVVVYNLAWKGLESLFNKGDNQVGGLENGSFGNVSSVSFDGETDLEVTFVPYSTDQIYIRSFTADYYDNENRHWIDNASKYKGEYFSDNEDEYTNTYKSLSENNTDYKFGTGRMIVSNVAAGDSKRFNPYYISYINSQITSSIGNENIYDYSTYMYDIHEVFELAEELKTTEVSDTKFAMEYYLQIPDTIRDELETFCRENGFKGNTPEIIEQIQTFMSDNYQYTLNPGITPEDEDYVMYFLNEQKKGICVHFASSACLLLRSMGIPARYVEGYSFDSSVYSDAVLYEDITRFKENQWYNGYSVIDFREPVSIDLTDTNAHAWVEVFIEGFGWIPIEFTVGQSDAETPGMLAELLNSLGSSAGNNQAVNALGAIQNLADSNAVKTIKVFFASALMSFVSWGTIAILIFLFIRKILMNIRLYYLKNSKRSVYQYRELAEILMSIKTKYNFYTELSDMPDENIYSSQVVRKILTDYFKIDCSTVDEYVNCYLQINFSSQEDVCLDLLTDRYRKLIYVLISYLKPYDRLKYKLHFFTFKRRKF